MCNMISGCVKTYPTVPMSLLSYGEGIHNKVGELVNMGKYKSLGNTRDCGNYTS